MPEKVFYTVKLKVLCGGFRTRPERVKNEEKVHYHDRHQPGLTTTLVDVVKTRSHL